MERAFELGIDVPKTLEGWADFFPRYTTLPWLKGRAHQRVQIMRDYLRIAFDRQPIADVKNGKLARTLQRLTALPSRWRLDHDVYALPWELWINRKLKHIRAAQKPQVDAKLLEPATSPS